MARLYSKSTEREHIVEFGSCRTAIRFFKAHPEFSDIPAKQLIAEKKALRSEADELTAGLSSMREKLNHFEQVSYWISQAIEKKPEPVIQPEQPKRQKHRNEPEL